jgi:hypothetical protein
MNIDSAAISKVKTSINAGTIPEKLVASVETSIKDGISGAVRNGFYSVVIGLNYNDLNTTKSIIGDIYRTLEPELFNLGYTVTKCSSYMELCGAMTGGLDSVYLYPNILGNVIKDKTYADKLDNEYIFILIEWCGIG